MHRLTQRQKSEKERKNPPEEDPEFQIAPMIDILLVLLVFFMSISSTEVLQRNHSITLPVAANGKDASKNSPGQVVINVFWSQIGQLGSVEVEGRKFHDSNAIIPFLQNSFAANPADRVLIRADHSVKWEYMKTVLKAVAQAGSANVTFSVLNKAEVSAPPTQ